MNISLAAEPLFHLGSFPITNALLTSWIVVLLLCVAALVVNRRLQTVPVGVQNATEALFDGMLGLMDTVTGHREQSKRFFPIVATIFLFVVTANWMGLLPGVGTIGLHEMHDGHEVFVPIFRAASSDLNVTLAIAIVSIAATQFFGIAFLGAGKYSKRFFNFKNPIFTFVGLLEFFLEIAKVLSFSFRLFGNVFAGEVLLIVIASLIPFLAPLPFYFLEIFVGFIQAFIFAILTLVFMKIATVESH